MLIYQLNIANTKELAAELAAIKCDPRGIKIMKEKLSRYTIKLTDLPGYLGLVIKETALSCGAECALPAGTIKEPKNNYDFILLANQHQLKKITKKLTEQAFRALVEISSHLNNLTKEARFKTPQLMGILNTTPDSFSDGGRYLQTEEALAHVKKMVRAGASIIDIGGESTRPGAEEISLKEELKRTMPIIKVLRQKFPKLTLSIDTTKSAVAKAAAAAGVKMINDISGLTRDRKIATIAAKYNCQLVLMHRSGNSQIMQEKTTYNDLLKDILSFLNNSAKQALAAGVKKENIIIDPGIGFGKTTKQNLYLIQQLGAFKALGYPVLLGASRKSVIGNILKNQPDERTAGTIATSLAGYLGQVAYLRLHDIKENNDALKIFNSIYGA